MKLYLIKKGDHYSDVGIFQRIFSFFSALGKKEVKFRFMFTGSCFIPGAKVTGVNKLAGIAWDTDNHQNSVRIGWDTERQIYAYVYVNGVRHYEVIGIVDPNLEYEATVSSTGIRVVGRSLLTEYAVNSKIKTNFFAHKNWVYYGGEDVAPKDMFIGLQWL